ncbi:MAG TPA: hypothetical protein VHU83_17035 [Bryobacteraceae bacterium]|nr:hypothetical protein [Bryobacteraceae bacterium]
MKIRFQADADLHPGIGRGLEALEPAIDFRLAQGVIPDGTPDLGVLRFAAKAGRVLVTRDARTMGKHFVAFTANDDSPGIILTPSRVGIGEAIRRLHNFWLNVTAEEMVKPNSLANEYPLAFTDGRSP